MKVNNVDSTTAPTATQEEDDEDEYLHKQQNSCITMLNQTQTNTIDFDLGDIDYNTMNTAPSPPSIQTAKLDLVKQLKLYLELCKLFNETDKNKIKLDKPRNDSLSSYSIINTASNSNLENFIKADQTEIEIDVDDEETDLRPNMKQSKGFNRLKPLLPFSLYSDNEIFIGRDWLFKEIDKGFESNQIVVLSGRSGTGKTKICQNLFRQSSIFQNTSTTSIRHQTPSICSSSSSSSIMDYLNAHNTTSSNLQLKYLASNLACAHFCSPDDFRTLETSQFLHNLAWSLTHFDQLTTKTNTNLYKEILNENNQSLFKKLINPDMCKLDPDLILKKCIIDPIETLIHSNSITLSNMHILIDGLDYSTRIDHSPSSVNNLGLFITRNSGLFPNWLKLILTFRSTDEGLTLNQNFHLINLDSTHCHKTCLNKDLNDYILFRINKSIEIQKNILFFNNLQSQNFDSNFQLKFVQHLSHLSDFNYLFVKLTLDLIEKGNLIVKSSNFKVLPKNFDDLIKLYFNLKFQSRFSYDRLASHIFSLCLASHRPLSLEQLYEAINCSDLLNEKINLNDLFDQISHLDGFISSFLYYEPDFDKFEINKEIKTVRTPLYTFSHPSLRDWWLEYHLSQFRVTSKPIFSPQWGYFLLGIRLFRSVEFRHETNSSKSSTRVFLDCIKYLTKSDQLITAETQTYLISLFISSNHLFTSSEFLSWPDRDLFRVFISLQSDLSLTVQYFNNSPFLCVLASLGHVDLLKEVIRHHGIQFDLTYIDQSRTNILCHATQSSQLDCCRFIIENSKEPLSMITQIDSNGYCALTCAACSIQILEYFIMLSGCSLSSIKLLLEQALVLSAANGNKDCLKCLVSTGCVSVDAVDSLKGETALTIACLNGHKFVCEYLVESLKAGLQVCNAKSWTPLLCAVKSGCWEIVEYLLNKSCDGINQADKHGRSALILAASEGHLAIMDILIEKGADLNSQDRDGLSALSWSCLKGHYNASLTLLDNHVDINHADHSGRTPLDLATFYGDVRLVQLLIERGSQIEHVDKIGMRPLDRAIGCRNVSVVLCFLKKGAKLNPATWAMAQGKPEIMITLLNKLVEDGNTLYRKACYDDALHRYSYTLKKFPKNSSELAILPENVKAVVEMKFNLLLNLARCHRKLQDFESSVELCSKAIELKSDSYEAFYSRARAKRDLKLYESALEDLEVASQLCNTNSDIKKLMNKINDEMNLKSNNSTLKTKHYLKNMPKQQKNTDMTQSQHSQHHLSYLIESPPL